MTLKQLQPKFLIPAFTVLLKNAGTLDASAELNKMLSTIYAIQIIIVTQVLIYWRFHRKPEHSHQQTLNVLEDSQHTTPVSNENKNIFDHEGDQALAKQILQVFEQQKMYLLVNLKVADVARKTGGSEYRVSRIFRHHFKARNFNPIINEISIKHAQLLLENTENIQWPIFVVGLKSGFASVGPFTLALKSSCDMTPNQYRQLHQSPYEETLVSVTRG